MYPEEEVNPGVLQTSRIMFFVARVKRRPCRYWKRTKECLLFEVEEILVNSHDVVVDVEEDSTKSEAD